MASRLIACRRLSGGLLQTGVDVSALEDMTTIRQLKAIFAKADPMCPPVPWVSLLEHHAHGQAGGLVDLSDSDEIPWAQLEASSTGMPTYIVRSPDLMPMVLNLLIETGHDVHRQILSHQQQEAGIASPGGGGWHFPQILFYEHFSDMMESVSWSQLREETRSEFWATLRFGLLNLQAEEANQIQDDGMTILIAMVRLCWHPKTALARWELEDMVLEFLSREDLSMEMINSVVRMSWSSGSFPKATVSALILSLREKQPYRDGRSVGGGSMCIAHRIMIILAERAPEVLGCVTSEMFGDTMLQHILEPTSKRHAFDKSEEEARFCLSIVANMSLPQLCHRNREGICALSYAEQFAANIDWDDWLHVRDALKHRMSLLTSKITSLPDLLQQVQLLEQAVISATYYELETAHLEEVVLATREVAQRFANQVRLEWLDKGYRFQARAVPEQVEEVIQHLQSRARI
mmetsp:Transcript_45553/g.90274  ORF Transcript_45553/g.90274 Transcript_45553/m.90274 type:complete len:462 (+) Transcript_45553:21-1406(+)